MLENKSITGSLEKKIYQLIIGRLEGEKIPIQVYQEKIFELTGRGIGGFIIFGGERDEVKSFISRLQSISEIPLFIASDIERGVGQQILGATPFPCQMALSAAVDRSNPGDVVVLRSAVKAIADEARDIGINMPLIPVLDVNRNPDNPIICTRAFSDKPEEVAWFGSEYIDILEGAGLVSCAKHFPGHGDTAADSHIELPVIHKSYKDLSDGDIIPFREAIHKGVGSIMVGHLCLPALDDRPASLSRRIITDILRGDLGFNGVIMTDALNMDALKEIGNVSVECLKAGADILLHPSDCEMAIEELMSAVKSEEIVAERIEEAVDRILGQKARLQKKERMDVDYQGHENLSCLITERSIGIAKNSGFSPIRDAGNVCLIFTGDGEMYESSPFKKYFKNFFAINEMKKEGDHESPTFSKVGAVQSRCGGEFFLGETTIFAIFTSVSAWKGSSGISEEEKSGIHDLIRKAEHSIVISFGSPYVLRHFEDADMLIAAYEATEQAQQAVLKCLDGRLNFKGRIPVEIADRPLRKG